MAFVGDHNEIRQLIVTVGPLTAAVGDVANQHIFIVNRGYQISRAWAVWTVASASGTVRLYKTTAGVAPASGTAISSALSTAGTANTPAIFTMNGNAADPIGEGNTIAIVVGGTQTGLENLHITLELNPV